MNQKPFIYLRGLRHADFTVFCVADGQKNYWDPQFSCAVPFSSGQQVKRSMIEMLDELLQVEPSPITFYSDVDKNGVIGEGEVISLCDPSYPDQLIGGWMSASQGGKTKTLKRRSPLSISAMTPLHPLLASLPKENISFDRSDRPDVHRVVVRDVSGNILSEEEIARKLAGSDRSLLRKWIQSNGRATGLFVYDVAIDLRRLFCVPTTEREPEITAGTLQKLQDAGWTEGKNAFGRCLIMPRARREEIIPALTEALIDWHITSNQSRTFSLMETLAVAISDNANTVAAAIRAKLIDDGSDKPKAKPIVDSHVGADTFISLPCAGYVVTEDEQADALDKAKEDLISRMRAFDYEHQL
jgi:hypothetical protein